MSFTDNANYFFKEISSNKFALSVGEKLKSESSLCAIWNNKIGPFSLDIDYKTSDLGQYVTIKSPKRILKHLSSLIGTTVFLKIKFAMEQFFVEAKVVEGLDLKSYHLVYTSTVYKAVRRSSFRYKCGEDDDIFVKINNIDIKLYDISTGGFSVLIKRDPQAILKVGQEISSLSVSIDNSLYSVKSSRIVNCFDYYKGPDYLKFGVKFDEIDYYEEKRLWVKLNKLMKKEYFRKISAK